MYIFIDLFSYILLIFRMPFFPFSFHYSIMYQLFIIIISSIGIIMYQYA